MVLFLKPLEKDSYLRCKRRYHVQAEVNSPQFASLLTRELKAKRGMGKNGWVSLVVLGFRVYVFGVFWCFFFFNFDIFCICFFPVGWFAVVVCFLADKEIRN